MRVWAARKEGVSLKDSDPLFSSERWYSYKKRMVCSKDETNYPSIVAQRISRSVEMRNFKDLRMIF